MVDDFSGVIDKDSLSNSVLKHKKRVSSIIDDQNLKNPRRDTQNEEDQTKRNVRKSVEDELAEKRKRMVGIFKREEVEKFDDKDKIKKENDRGLKRRGSQFSSRKRNKSLFKRNRKPSSISSINPGHVCSSSCPANHWMKEDEEWIDNDEVSSEEENHAWFPDYSSDTSTNNDR